MTTVRTIRKPIPVVAGRPLREIKEEAAAAGRWPGDIRGKGLPATMGPVRSRR